MNMSFCILSDILYYTQNILEEWPGVAISSISLKKEIPFHTEVYIIWGLRLSLEGRHSLLAVLCNFLCIITIL